MAQEIQQPIHQNGSSNNHPLDEIKSLFEGEHKVWLKKKSWWTKNCFPRIFRRNKGETGDSEPAQAEEVDEGLRRIVTESKLPSHKIHGFDNEIEGLRNFVLKKEGEDEFKALAMVGQPGIGKTTLCQMIFNEEDVKKRFAPRIWVSMYGEIQGNLNPKIAIVIRILENLGVEEEIIEQGGQQETEDSILSRLLYVLHLQLWGKKFLIVLDDVCKSDGWDERFDEKNPKGDNNWGTHVACGFPKMSGGRVIVSTRNTELAAKLVGEDNLHRMFPITDHESCWSIYWDAVVEENSRVQAKIGNAVVAGNSRVETANGGAAVAENSRVKNANGDAVVEENPGVKSDKEFKKSYDDFVKKMEDGDVKNLKKCKEELMNKTGGVPMAARLLKRVLPQEYVPPVKLDDDNQTNTDVHQNNTDQNNTQPKGTEQNDTEGNDGDGTGAEENGGDLTNQTDNNGNNTDRTITEQNGTVGTDSGQNNNNQNAGNRTGSDQTGTNTNTDESSTE